MKASPNFIGTSSTGPALLVAAALSTLTPAVEARSKFEDTAKPVAVVRPSNAHVLRNRADNLAIAKVRQFGAYDDGWKGPGSVAPSEAAVNDAEAFIRSFFRNENMEKPHVGLASDGEINFYWKTNRVVIDLSILGDGGYTYYARAADGRSYSGDDVAISESLPAELSELLKLTT